MDVEEIRRVNINYWAEVLGRGKLAEKVGYKDTIYINQLCGGHGSFGSRTARKFEKALDLANGWFDQLHEPDDPKKQVVLGKIATIAKDFTPSELAELMAQAALIEKRKRGEL